MSYCQQTLAKSVTCSGTGVHSGQESTVTIAPAPVNHGIKFTRTDLTHTPDIPALFKMVTDTSSATVLGFDGVIVSTVEHLLASLAGLGVDNALISIDSYELPIMDGSAKPFTEKIVAAGVKEQGAPRCFFIIKEPIEFEEGDKFVGIYPDTGFKITYTIDYDHFLIGQQTCSLEITEATFREEISDARTFGFYHEYEYFKSLGLARGGSLENAVVIDSEGILNPEGLRWPNEFVRHKMLDCLGDFSLLGMPIQGHIVARKSGHLFNHQLLQKFFQHKECWETKVLEKPPSLKSTAA